MKVSQSDTFPELWKFLQVQSQKPSSAMMKLTFMRTSTGKKDPELPLLQRISSLALPDSEIAAQINASQSSSNISTSTVQRRLCESGLHGWIAAKKPLLKDTNNKKKLGWAKKHEQWTLDRRKSVLWSDESKFELFGSNRRVCVRSRGEWMISACMVPTWSMEEMWWCGGALLVTLSVIYLEFKAHLTSMATTAFCSDTPSHLVCT